MSKRGDLISYTDPKGKTLYALLLSGTNRPDAHWRILTPKAAPKVFAASCSPCGVTVAGVQHLNHQQARIHAELTEFAASKVGKSLIADAKMPTTVREIRGKRTVVRDEGYPAPSLGPGRPASTDVPASLRTVPSGDERDHNSRLERYLAVRDPTAAPADLDLDAHEVRYLDRLRARNSRYYAAYVALKIQRRKPAELAELLGISAGAARVLGHRAKAAYEAEARRNFTS